MKRLTTYSMIICAACGVLMTNKQAQAQHADALLIINPADELVVGQYDVDESEVVNTNTRILEGEFDAFGTIDEPGFNALSSTHPGIPAGYSALPGDTDVNFTGKAFTLASQTSNLWFWDATGQVEFTPVTDGTILNVSKAPAVSFSADFDGTSSDVAGFAIDTTNAQGFLHKHIDFSIIDANTAPEGFYLWAFEISVGSYATDLLYFVHGLGEHDEELHENAIAYVETNLVPEPASVTLLIAGAMAMWRRRASA